MLNLYKQMLDLLSLSYNNRPSWAGCALSPPLPSSTVANANPARAIDSGLLLAPAVDHCPAEMQPHPTGGAPTAPPPPPPAVHGVAPYLRQSKTLKAATSTTTPVARQPHRRPLPLPPTPTPVASPPLLFPYLNGDGSRPCATGRLQPARATLSIGGSIMDDEKSTLPSPRCRFAG